MLESGRLLCVLRYLQEHSDEQHPVTTTQILNHLEKQGLKTDRRTIPKDISLLVELGYDIIPRKSSQNLYFIGERDFELPEIKLLIEAVLSSKFITPKKSEILVDKLRGFASVHQRAEISEDLYVTAVKPLNENIYVTADIIQSAKNQKKKIAFKYFEYRPDKSKEFKHNGFTYHLSPYRLLWNEDKYYILGFSEKHGKIVTFRVDRMHGVKALREDSIPCPSDFDINEFCKRVFEMYDGETVKVELECRNELMKVLVDKFGEDFYTEILNEDWFKAVIDVDISPIFYGWLFQFTGRMKLTAPAEILNEYRKMLFNADKSI